MTNKQVRVAQVIFAGAATIATLTLVSAASPGSAETAVASGSVGATAPASAQSPPTAQTIVGGRVIAVDDNGNSVNDQGQTSGDEFTQNAQDQSTA
jgi:hypothetical protein